MAVIINKRFASGYGSGAGSGDGYGAGAGFGYSAGAGSGDGCGSGVGDGSGDGAGCGYGAGYGDGCGDNGGCGSGSGHGDYIFDHNTPIIAWHCVRKDLYLRYNHGKKIKAEAGLVLICEGDLSMCEYGLHASMKLSDARKYLDGIPCRVACSGRILWGCDKICCERREILEIFDKPTRT